jgi:sulfatase maturation enzyme AslB (radical SAM superfamily)
MPDPSIFCSAPWYELQIYWDGSLGFCCQESHRIHNDNDVYNVKKMSIREWFDSPPMRDARLAMHRDQKISFCSRCYTEEQHANTSRRHKSNQKSVIFTRSNFLDSYQQSPGRHKFEKSRIEQGSYDGMPIDLHIDLGNYCNLACKMCNPCASSKIAVQHVKWGFQDADQYIMTDWTRDQVTWNRVLTELAGISNLRNVHFMGGETLVTKRFEDFVDFMMLQGRTDLNFSFVTNGTTFNHSLMEKLKKFQRVGIEVSIETVTEHNAYQRQGTETSLVLQNIDRYLDLCDDDRITVTPRPAISALTIGNYTSLLEYCLHKKIIVKSLLVNNPRYYDAVILPQDVKKLYEDRFRDFFYRHQLHKEDITGDYNESDPNHIRRIIKSQVMECINILTTATPNDSEQALSEMVSWCQRWDHTFGLDARVLYPELQKTLDLHGY